MEYRYFVKNQAWLPDRQGHSEPMARSVTPVAINPATAAPARISVQMRAEVDRVILS